MLGQPAQSIEHRADVGEVHVLVVRERAARRLGQRVRRLVADADDTCSHVREPASEVRHLGRVTGREHDDGARTHCASAISTRIPVITRCNASRTVSVSCARTVT